MKVGTFSVKWTDPIHWEVKAEGFEPGEAPPWPHRAALSESKAIDIADALNRLSQETLDAGRLELVGRVINQVIVGPHESGGA
jgi:hypothetical protein